MPWPSSSRGRLTALAFGAAVLWLVVWPAVGRLAPLAARIDALRGAGVEPGALYYSDHPAAWRALAAVAERRESAGDAFWRCGRRPCRQAP